MFLLFTCKTCDLSFETGDSQRQHMKSDLHRYNSKRKIADLPPVSATSCTSEVNAKSHLPTEIPCKTKIKNSILKVDNSTPVMADDGHITFKDPFVDLDTLKLPYKVHCLYCKHATRSIETNLAHMLKSHSLIIPDREFLIDLPSLLEHLYSKIRVDYKCLGCNYNGRTLDDILEHITYAKHYEIPYRTLSEKQSLSKFYDYNTHDIERHGSNKNVSFAEIIASFKENDNSHDKEHGNENDEWENISDDEIGNPNTSDSSDSLDSLDSSDSDENSYDFIIPQHSLLVDGISSNYKINGNNRSFEETPRSTQNSLELLESFSKKQLSVPPSLPTTTNSSSSSLSGSYHSNGSTRKYRKSKHSPSFIKSENRHHRRIRA